MPVTIIFYLFIWKGILQGSSLKKNNKSMDTKLDTPSTLGYL